MITNLSSLLKAGDARARGLALRALEAALKASNARSMVEAYVRRRKERLEIMGLRLDMAEFNRVIVVGGGKASGAMAEAVEEILGDHITTGLVIIPELLKERYKLKRIRLCRARHPIPSEEGVMGVEKMLKLVEGVGEKDLVLCLISGGGSALMPMPLPGLSLEDKQMVTAELLRSGADIGEVNTVRKHLSAFKGGRLAERLCPAEVVSLIISDVVGDRLDIIASGPTAPDPTTYSDAIEVLRRRRVWDKAPHSVKRVLKKGVVGELPETPKPESVAFKRTHNLVIGSNRLACDAAIASLKQRGLNTMLMTTLLQGEAREAGSLLSAVALEVRSTGTPIAKPAAVVAGGETTVTVRGRGRGGRNQELALSSALKIDGLKGVAVASIATDGVDGPTDAAGAVCDGETVGRSVRLGLKAESFLARNDAYTFFSRLNDLILTGPTGANVNDVTVIVVL